MTATMVDVENGLRALQSHWDQRAERAATDAERVDATRRPQRMRFENFLLANDLRGKSVLDIGCGVGDFWEHLCVKKIDCVYVGIDLSPAMIDRCRTRFPGVTFEARNPLDWQPAQRFDYVVAIAVHNVQVPDAEALLERLTRRQFELCQVAAHLSLLTDRFAGFAPPAMPWRAERVLSMALAITPYVSLQHHYLPHDFGVTLYREPIIDTRAGLHLG